MTNDVAELSGVVNPTSADVTLDTDGRDCSFKGRVKVHIVLMCMRTVWWVVWEWGDLEPGGGATSV